jgi:hypothetical protein
MINRPTIVCLLLALAVLGGCTRATHGHREGIDITVDVDASGPDGQCDVFFEALHDTSVEQESDELKLPQ